MTAYYNEHDPFAAQWLRNLIKAGHIAPGDVDERSIEDVTPNEIKSYDQCHFFAGIGTWSYALRKAGWPDDRPVWTGSAPCQPFSAAGKGEGFADERHLWPAFLWLISQQQPPVIFGEQVASKAGRDWFDVVSSDLEAYGYAIGAADLCAAGVGAPHIRQRLYFVADAAGGEQWRLREGGAGNGWRQLQTGGFGTAGVAQGDASRQGLEERRRQRGNNEPQFTATKRTGGQFGELAHASIEGERQISIRQGRQKRNETADVERNGRPGIMGDASSGRCERPSQTLRSGRVVAELSGATNGFWSNADWLPCLDGKARPVEPGTFPLAHGAAARVGRLRGYGNGIVAPLAVEFIKAYME